MQFDWLTFGLQIVNFAVLIWLLSRFLYRPALSLLDARQADLRRQYDEAEAAKTEAGRLLEQTRAERAGIAAEREAALKAALAEAEEAAKAQRERAGRDAEALLADARRTLAGERDAALAEARRAALDLGADVTRRLLAGMPMKFRAEAWLERVESTLATLPQKELDGLLGQLRDGAALTVVTASPLPAEIADLWRERLRRPFGDHLVLTFRSDPDLVAGAELYFPTAILSFSLRSELAALRAEIEEKHPGARSPESKSLGSNGPESSHGAAR